MPLYKVPEPPKATHYPLTSPRGARLATRVWRPTTARRPPRALVLLVHSGGMHSGYFDGLARRLNQDNIFCGAYDQVSHGYSDAEPGSPSRGGGAIHVHEFEDYVEDVLCAAEWIRKEADENDKVPLFLLGEAMGGLEVLSAVLDVSTRRAYGAQENNNIAGVIVLNAMLKLSAGIVPPKPMIKILNCLAFYYPKMTMPTSDLSDSFDGMFGDERWAETARNDPVVKVPPRLTLTTAMAVMQTGESVLQAAREFRLPLLAIHAVRDPRCQFEATQQFVDQVGPTYAVGYWVEDASGHLLLQDRPSVSIRVMEKIAEWIGEHL